MKRIDDRTMHFQGDLMVRSVAQIPRGLALADEPEGGHIVAHSETGHHHVVVARPGAKATIHRNIDEELGMVAYLEVTGDSVELRHLRPTDTHETIEIPVGLWELRRQREYVPEGWRRVED